MHISLLKNVRENEVVEIVRQILCQLSKIFSSNGNRQNKNVVKQFKTIWKLCSRRGTW